MYEQPEDKNELVIFFSWIEVAKGRKAKRKKNW